MGIKYAYNEPPPVALGFYASDCPNWRLAWQVSGRLHSGTKQSSLSSSLVSYRTQNNSGMPSFGFSPSKQTMQALRGTMVCVSRTLLAAGLPLCARIKICRRKPWWRVCNVMDWTSAGMCWLTLKPDENESRTRCFPFSSAPWAFPSSGFSQKKFETSTPNLPPTPLPVRLEPRPRNVKS